MPRVFIPQVPSKLVGNLWVPTVNIKPAERWGELNVILPPAAARAGIDACTATLKDALQDFGREDFLLALGDPSLYAVAAVIAARRAEGVLRMLKWDRQSTSYVLEEVDTNE